MTNQELFDKVASHLLTQKAKSLENTGVCAYRGEDGLKCAIGCLIPDDKYDPNWEGHGIGSCDELREAAGISQNQIDLAGDLVMVHDFDPVEEWPEYLTKLAGRYSLNPRIVETHG